MQNSHHHIDQKLRELDSQSLPDLSKIDEHWKQMRADLVPVSKSVSMTKKYGWWIVAASIILTTATILLLRNKNTGESNIASVESIAGAEGLSLQDTLPRKKVARKASTITADTVRRKNPVKRASVPAKADTIRSSKEAIASEPTERTVKRITATPIPENKKVLTLKAKRSVPVKKSFPLKVRTSDGKDTVFDATITVDSVIEENLLPEETLEKFFKAMEKTPQEFSIDNRKDTIVFGNEGTGLFIPANSFDAHGEIVLKITEYYSYRDIICNRLTTTSNGELLETGGMIHIEASSHNKKVELKKGRSIRWFVPGEGESMSRMKLFTKNENNRSSKARFNNRDSIDGANTAIDWVNQEVLFMNNYLANEVKVLDLRDNPYKVNYSENKSVAHFGRARDAVLTKRELKAILKEKYDYSKVVVKQLRRSTPLFNWYRLFGKYTAPIGDSIWIPESTAKRYDLGYSQKTTSMGGSKFQWVLGQEYNRTSMQSAFESLKGKFSVDITELGWINCDRFYNSNDRINFYVDIKDKASNYFTMLVFTGIKGFMTGQMQGSQVRFANIPVGEPAILLCVGIKNGKTQSAIKKLTVSSATVTDLQFEETSPTSFKEVATTLDK